MTELEQLRARLTNEQRQMLTAIWNHYRINKRPIPTRGIHLKFGTNGKARASLEQLGGSIVHDVEQNGIKYYHITFLGILLTEDASSCEQLLISYLAYVFEKCAEDMNYERVKSEEVEKALKIDSEQLTLLGELISTGGFSTGSGGSGAGNWNYGIPPHIEDLQDEGLKEYIHRRVMERYDPNAPKSGSDLYVYRGNKEVKPPSTENKSELVSGAITNTYIHSSRIAELVAINSPEFDLKRLIKLCEELNICYSNGCYIAVAMLNRALLDHVPPIFGKSNFSDVANHYEGTKSFKETMVRLDESCRRIADASLHERIRKKETLINETRVNFSHDIDVLLGEIVRIL